MFLNKKRHTLCKNLGIVKKTNAHTYKKMFTSKENILQKYFVVEKCPCSCKFEAPSNHSDSFI